MQKLTNQSEWIDRGRIPAEDLETLILLYLFVKVRVQGLGKMVIICRLLIFGPMLIGHSNPEVEEAVLSQISKGTTFFANNIWCRIS